MTDDKGLIPRYILAPSNTLYFAQLFATADTEISPNDKKAVKLAKKHVEIRRIAAVVEGIRQPWFQAMLVALERRLFTITGELYWDALAKGDQATAMGFEIERTGIHMLLKSIHDIPAKLAAVIADFHQIRDEKDDGSQGDTKLEINDYEEILNPPIEEGQN